MKSEDYRKFLRDLEHDIFNSYPIIGTTGAYVCGWVGNRKEETSMKHEEINASCFKEALWLSV